MIPNYHIFAFAFYTEDSYQRGEDEVERLRQWQAGQGARTFVEMRIRRVWVKAVMRG